jgi:beta-barrel assembly-enhancing protease
MGEIVTRRIPAAAILLLCACMALTARAAILPTDLEPRVGADYQPADADERAIWQSLERLEETIRTSPQRVTAPELDAYTRGVVERLIGRLAPDLRIYLMHDASLNAAMLPNGMMIVNTGLLARVRNEAQLAAVLAHEAGHYFRKHALDLHRDSRRKSAMAEAASSALNSYSESYGGWSLINHAITMSGFRFSRDLESEADAYGLMLMARAGYPPRAASSIWGQVVDERRASAAARHKRYRDGTSSVLSTHPPTRDRMIDLGDTANRLAGKRALPDGDGREEWVAVIRPHQAMLLKEQIYLDDPGASLYLLENLAKDGWTGLLRFNEGEVYRLRNANGDGAKAAAAYAAATALGDAPPEAWCAHGFALLKAGKKSEAYEALNRYLAARPDAPDAAMIRFTVSSDRLSSADETDEAGRDMNVKAGSSWKKLPSSASQSRWEDVWTWNGPQLDRVTLINGLPDGMANVARNTSLDHQAPVFRADMTTQDLASMLEVAYRVNGVTVFDFESVEPVDFLGGPGVRLHYNYVSGIAFTKKGDCVMRVVGGKLYAMKLESLAGDAFDRVAPEFDRLIVRAELRR